MSRSADVLTLTAYHEAGHAAVALHLGRPIHKVSIEPQRQRLGHCQLTRGSSKPAASVIEREALILLAGMAAESRMSGRYNLEAAARDLRELETLSEIGGGSERQLARAQRRWLDKVESLLDRPGVWTTVSAIAKALLEQQTISGRMARHLYEQEMQRVQE